MYCPPTHNEKQADECGHIYICSSFCCTCHLHASPTLRRGDESYTHPLKHILLIGLNPEGRPLHRVSTHHCVNNRFPWQSKSPTSSNHTNPSQVRKISFSPLTVASIYQNAMQCQCMLGCDTVTLILSFFCSICAFLLSRPTTRFRYRQERHNKEINHCTFFFHVCQPDQYLIHFFDLLSA